MLCFRKNRRHYKISFSGVDVYDDWSERNSLAALSLSDIDEVNIKVVSIPPRLDMNHEFMKSIVRNQLDRFVRWIR
ncbi:unnamed protein product [Thelazia callipaeda]|uniref:Transposase n=1 Tax=Thelazia callipaeda TaxID=103827 RepID=A0A0N5D4D5_THECL|nr:unnamed protein product [Thelazia callipaeda]